MALVKATLETAILNALDSNSDISVDPDGNPVSIAQKATDARADMAGKLATAIDDFVKSGIVNTTVSTAGSASAQAGTGVGSVS